MKRVRQASKYLLKCLDPFCYDNKTFRDHSICRREYSSYANLIGEQRLNKTPVFSLPYCACNFPSPLLNNEAELSRERFGLNEMIRFLLSYQFKREDMRVELALWIRRLNWGFLIEKGQLNCGKSLVSILFITLYTEELFTVPCTRISNLFFSGKKLPCRRLCW